MSLFVRVTNDSNMYVLVYVDDIIITGSAPNNINIFVQQLHKEFSFKDMRCFHYFLGIEVTRSSIGCLHLCQRKYIMDLLNKSSLANAKGVHTPMISYSYCLRMREFVSVILLNIEVLSALYNMWSLLGLILFMW